MGFIKKSYFLDCGIKKIEKYPGILQMDSQLRHKSPEGF